MAAQLPPSVERDPALHARLEAAYAAKGPDYVPRTHLMDGGAARYVNRLIEEVSPYLLQHAHNPVDWRPWSDETLAEAKARDLPIFLSVGYATCHWCHVMEEESFDNEDVAAVLNASFIPVKVDREQHPEIDHLYIMATQLQRRQAGWPNSVWLMPDGRPFHTGTYMPREQFVQVLGGIATLWNDGRRGEAETLATQLATAINRISRLVDEPAVELGPEAPATATATLAQMHNALEGGFSDSQQFPQEGYILFLLDQWRATGEAEPLAIARLTLDAIVAGGLHDHVGGGFHRYTVDPNWRTPHFEKMLYNQGLMARALIEAWEITASPAYRRAAERTFAYVARDMTDGAGAFHAAEDADSRDARGELEEGAFYVWPPMEAAKAGGPAAVALLGLDQAPTLDAGPVAHLELGAEVDFAALDPILEALRTARDARVRPFRDTKIIAGWNGLMIRALADGAAAFGSPAYADQAGRAADAIWDRLWNGERLGRLWADGRAHGEGALEDYAWLGLGMLALFEATGETHWHGRAMTLAEAAWRRFGDGSGRLRMAAAEGPIGPIYDSADGAVPAGESSALELLARLARTGGGPEAAARARALRDALSAPMARQPLLRPDALAAARHLADGGRGPRQTLAEGKVRVHLTDGHLRIRIAPDWHVNAHVPGPDWLVGARLDGAEAVWPDGQPVTLGFSAETMRVYDGQIEIPVTLTAPVLSLHLQACSDSVCLAPDAAHIRVP